MRERRGEGRGGDKIDIDYKYRKLVNWNETRVSDRTKTFDRRYGLSVSICLASVACSFICESTDIGTSFICGVTNLSDKRKLICNEPLHT